MRIALTVLTLALPVQSAAQGRGYLYLVGGGPQPAALAQEFVGGPAGSATLP